MLFAIAGRCNETLLSSAVHPRRHDRASAARPWNRASRNLIINASTSVSVAPGSSELAEQKEEGKNERAAAASKKRGFGYTFADLAVPGERARARASGRALRLSRDKGRLIQGPTDVHAHMHRPFVYRAAAHSSTARRIEETRGRDRVSSMPLLSRERERERERERAAGH